MPTPVPEPNLSRRRLLQFAGGITFSALLPVEHGFFGTLFQPSIGGRDAAPKFTAFPYLQPGPTGGKLLEGREGIVIAWQTDGAPATFEVAYGHGKFSHHADVAKSDRQSADFAGGALVNYSAHLEGLRLHTQYQYQVRMNGEVLLEGFFTTRKPRGAKCRFVAFGDNSCGSLNDHAIAYQAFVAKPDFVMNVGDNVYNHGLDSEYARHFFPVYNAEAADPSRGAPLLRSIPFYSVLANHDLTGNDPRDRQVADFSRHPDSLGYFTNLHFPLNGPTPTYPMTAYGDEAAIARFRESAGARYPRMGNYSFDYGDVHFLCLDSNIYVDPTDGPLQSWIEEDLRHTDAAWKMVVFHHPPFNVGKEHYVEQHMRVLSPLFERCGVAVVLCGHEHNYQRSKPLTFAPHGVGDAQKVNHGHRLVPGDFRVDTRFDGQTITRPEGVIYLVTGAGGNDLYDPESHNNPAAWPHAEDNHVEYVARMISDRHSLTVVDADRHTLAFVQIDKQGHEVDRFTVTHA